MCALFKDGLADWTVGRNMTLTLVEAEAEAEVGSYCRQLAGMLNLGIGTRWDPWPYICWKLKPLFFSFR
jgi:hypothetical protein